jgi:hypothetical protein
MLDLPAPVRPTTPTCAPPGMVRLRDLIAGGSSYILRHIHVRTRAHRSLLSQLLSFNLYVPGTT